MSAYTTARVGDMRIEQENGEVVIAPTQRADGSWRPEIRVKKGYIPQEEVGVWKSSRQIAQEQRMRVADEAITRDHSKIIMGHSVDSKKAEKNRRKNERRKEKQREKEEAAKEGPIPVEVAMEPVAEEKSKEVEDMELEELQKLEKRTKKKLGQISVIEEKKAEGGELTLEQVEKMNSKSSMEELLNRVVEAIAKRG